MSEAAPRLPDDVPIPELAAAVRDAGGRLLVVGGWVRDALIGRASRDFDLEVFGLTREQADRLLRDRGFTPPVGRQFPVWRHTGQALDVAHPRAGALDYDPAEPGSLDAAFARAARHRDLTVDAIAWDPLEARLIDPFSGRDDLAERRLRAVDPATFVADPLRPLRVARLAAVLEARADDALVRLCRGIDLGSVAVERIAGELERMLLDPTRPSRAFETLETLAQLGVFAPVAALRGVPQDPRWHPEGDVYVHTLMVLDRAAELGRALSGEARRVLMFAALGHDLGKPETTTVEGERVRALGHERRSAERSVEWLSALRLGQPLVRAVDVLVADHLSPVQYVSQGAGPRGYRRLARRLAAGGMTVVELERLARADHLGRTTEEALAGRFEAGDRFLERAREIGVLEGATRDRVDASVLMRRGIEPGPRLGRILARCRDVQDETGWQDPERILDRALGREDDPRRA